MGCSGSKPEIDEEALGTYSQLRPDSGLLVGRKTRSLSAKDLFGCRGTGSPSDSLHNLCRKNRVAHASQESIDSQDEIQIEFPPEKVIEVENLGLPEKVIQNEVSPEKNVGSPENNAEEIEPIVSEEKELATEKSEEIKETEKPEKESEVVNEMPKKERETPKKKQENNFPEITPGNLFPVGKVEVVESPGSKIPARGDHFPVEWPEKEEGGDSGNNVNVRGLNVNTFKVIEDEEYVRSSPSFREYYFASLKETGDTSNDSAGPQDSKENGKSGNKNKDGDDKGSRDCGEDKANKRIMRRKFQALARSTLLVNNLLSTRYCYKPSDHDRPQLLPKKPDSAESAEEVH
ncbi:hypothetical protein AMTRI_Chr06g192140 [Amborella trichopoda]